MTKNPTFEIGQRVIATGSYMHSLTEGKEYIVTGYQPEQRDTNFTWPEYVTVTGDLGKPVTGHAYRFRPVGA